MCIPLKNRTLFHSLLPPPPHWIRSHEQLFRSLNISHHGYLRAYSSKPTETQLPSMKPITEQTNNICWIQAIVYVSKSLARRVRGADGFSYPMNYSWRIQCPTGTYHVSQRECHLLQRVQNLPAAWSCSLRSLVGAGDDFVSVPPTDHQELWTGNYYQNKNVGHNLLKI